jgi:hypothetical protein
MKIKYQGMRKDSNLEMSGGQKVLDLCFVKKLLFDKHRRFLIAYGDYKVLILNINTSQVNFHTLHHRSYDFIMDISFKSANQQ